MTQWESLFDETLAQAFGFDRPTLEANRQGHMTVPQQQRLMQIRLRKLVRHGGSGGLLIGFTIGLLITAYSPVTLVIAFMLLGYATNQWLKALRLWHQITGDAAAGVVIEIAGRASKYNWGWLRVLFVERGAFREVTPAQWRAFQHRGRYRVFCTPRSRQILAAQPVHADEPLPKAWASRLDD